MNINKQLKNVDDQLHKMQRLKFVGANTNKYYQPSNKKVRNNEQSRVSVIKVYQMFPKQPSRITFGSKQFRNNNHSQSRQINPQHIVPITHKHSNQSKIQLQSDLVQNLKNKPKIYNIINKQLGLSEKNIESMKEDALNYELQKYLKKKGLQYLEQSKQKIRRVQTQFQKQSRSLSQQQQQTAATQQKRSRLQKYPNYIPEVFPHSVEKRKKTKQEPKNNQQILKDKKSKRRSQSKKQIKLGLLNDRQEMLGKLVFSKVQSYFDLNKNKPSYFERVKSQQRIDEAWIQFLKAKMDRADLLLQNSQQNKNAKIKR